jgi:hypothetical protein
MAKDLFYAVLSRLRDLYPHFGRADMTFKLPRRRKAAAKMHTVLDARTFLPTVAVVQSAAPSDAATARGLALR